MNDSNNGLSPDRHQTINLTKSGILSIWPLGINFNEMLIELDTFAFMKMHLKMSSVKWHPFCFGINVSMTTEQYNSLGLLSIFYSVCAILTLYVLNFFGENINIYLHIMSFLHINKTQVVEIPPRVKQGPAYWTQSISWLLMSWRRKEPGHQQPWYWPSLTELTRSPHVKG